MSSELFAMRSQYAGSVIFNTGFVCYIYLAYQSLRLLARMPKLNPSRRLLLPYTIILLVINTTFAITQNVLMEEETIEGPFGAWKQGGCSPLLVLRSIFVAFPIFLNDFLFLYRAAQLTNWRPRTLPVPCLLYLFSFGSRIFSLTMFRMRDCSSTEGMPPDLVLTVTGTAVLNMVLGGIIVHKLYWARRSMLAISQRSGTALSQKGGIARRYARLAAFVVESALLWIVAAALHVATAVPYTTAGIAPLFELIFEITTIISPVLLTYQIAQDKQDTTLDQTASQTRMPIFTSIYEFPVRGETVVEKGPSQTA